jgi:hypothetical protein
MVSLCATGAYCSIILVHTLGVQWVFDARERSLEVSG